jgi:MFS family permease
VVGRKRPIVFSFLAASITICALAVLGHLRGFAFGLIISLGVVGAPAFTLDRVLVADLVTEDDRREAGYAAVRVATNLGAFSGPPMGAALIAVGGWTTFLLAIAALGIVGAVISGTVLPSVSATAAPAATAMQRGAMRRVLSDRPFLLLLLSTLLGYTIYCGFETVLPVIAVSTYRVAPATWGLLVITSPLLVVVLQLRLTAATARIHPKRRLGAAILLMGLPFLALIGSASIPVIVAIIVVFVLGEMVWMPTSQAVAAQLAPPHARGTYLGSLAAMTGPAWTLTPFIAFTLRTHVGVASIWILLATIALGAAAAGFAALHAGRIPEPTRSPPRGGREDPSCVPA